MKFSAWFCIAIFLAFGLFLATVGQTAYMKYSGLPKMEKELEVLAARVTVHYYHKPESYFDYSRSNTIFLRSRGAIPIKIVRLRARAMGSQVVADSTKISISIR